MVPQSGNNSQKRNKKKKDARSKYSLKYQIKYPNSPKFGTQKN